MAKPTKFAADSEKAKQAELQDKLAARTYVLDKSAWDRADSVEYGGQSDILLMNIGDVCGPFTYMGHQPMKTELGDTTVHLATDESKNTLRLPIAASFVRSADQAELKRGDTFIIMRNEDVVKKAGVGKGQKMQIYALKVTSRSAVGV